MRETARSRARRGAIRVGTSSRSSTASPIQSQPSSDRRRTAAPRGMGALAAVRVRVVRAIAAAYGPPLGVVTARAWRQALGRADVDRVAAVGALVGAGGYVAACWDWFCHLVSFSWRFSERSEADLPDQLLGVDPVFRSTTKRTAARRFGWRPAARAAARGTGRNPSDLLA